MNFTNLPNYNADSKNTRRFETCSKNLFTERYLRDGSNIIKQTFYFSYVP